MTRIARGAVATVLSAALALPAAAGCCDDFWGCAAAVATAGVSCAVEAAVATLQDLIRKTGDARDAAPRRAIAVVEKEIESLQIQLDAVDLEIKALIQKLDAAADAGEKLYQGDRQKTKTALAASAPAAPASKLAPSARVAATPATSRLAVSSAEEVARLRGLDADPSLADLEAQLAELKKEKSILVDKMAKTEASLLGLEAAQVKAVQAACDARIRPPLDDFLALLRKALTSPQDVAGLVQQGAKLLVDLDAALGQIVDDALAPVDKAGAETLAALGDLGEKLRRLAADAQATLDRMARMVALRTAAERHALAVTPMPVPSPAPGLAHRTLRGAAGGRKGAPEGFASLRAEFVRAGQSVGSKADVTPYRPRLATQFDAFFRGKAAADAKKKREELLSEARRRFASDPKTLAAVEKLISDEARARGVPL